MGLSLSKMVFGTTTRALASKFSTSAVARSQGWQQYGIPGANLPFDISNKYKLTVFFALFVLSATRSSRSSAPFGIARERDAERKSSSLETGKDGNFLPCHQQGRWSPLSR